MSYDKEFIATDYTIPTFLQTANWVDCSWHNDVCPRFENSNLETVIWVAETDQTKREFLNWKQYTVVKLELITLETDSIEELEDYVHKLELRDSLQACFILAGLHSCTHHIADELAELLTQL